MSKQQTQVTEHDDQPEEKSVLVGENGKQLSAETVHPRKEVATTTCGVSDLIAMAINQGLDIEKLERLMEMKEREEAKTAYAEFVVAISNFQAKCPVVKKTGIVTDKTGKRLYTYPKFDEIMKTIQPHTDKNNLSVRFNSDISDGHVKVHCMVSHVGGHTDNSYFSCPIEASMPGNINASQRTASANSFAKRYAIMNALNIAGADFDDDGQSLAADAPTITPEQAAALRDHLSVFDDAKQAEADLCGFLKVNSLEDLSVKLHSKAQKAINEQKKAEGKL